MTLSPHQMRVVELIALGKSNKEIARALGVSAETVKVHIKTALRRSRLTNRTLLAVAFVAGRLALQTNRGDSHDGSATLYRIAQERTDGG